MEMDSDEDLLHRLAAGGSVDYAAWPRLLCTIVSRIETIAHNDFPIPVLPPPKPHSLVRPPVVPSTVVPSENGNGPGGAAGNGAAAPDADSNPSSQEDMNKENTNPVPQPAPPADTSDAAAADTSTVSSNSNSTATATGAPVSLGGIVGASSPRSASDIDLDSVLPPQISNLLNLIIATLTTTFAQYPPHTVQRLCELVLSPRQHYRSLASYLHALDRVVSVSSGSNVYPLPPAVPDMSAMSMLANGISPGITNGDAAGNGTHATALNVGSDEALGGALLTPIPWLRRRPTSAGDDNNTEEGSSPPSSSDSGDVPIISAASSVNGGVGVAAMGSGYASDGSATAATAAQAASASPLAEQQQPQQQQQQEPEEAEQETEPDSEDQSEESQQQQQQQQQNGSNSSSTSHIIEGRVRTESTETIEGPNGVGSIETVSVSVNGIPSHGAMAAAVQLQQQRGITQGELLRQEQKAGVVPVSQLARAQAVVQAVSSGGHAHEDEDQGARSTFTRETSKIEEAVPADSADAPMTGMDAASPGEGVAASAEEEAEKKPAEGAEERDKTTSEEEGAEDEEDEVPHARGPEEIGAADMGPQRTTTTAAAGGTAEAAGSSFVISSSSDGSVVAVHGMDMEAAVGRKAVPVETTGATAAPAPAVDGTNKAAGAAGQDEDMKDADEEEESPSSSAEESPATLRATTPKREAEGEAPAALPAKKRKEERDGDVDDGGAPDKDDGWVLTPKDPEAEDKAKEGAETAAESAEEQPSGTSTPKDKGTTRTSL